MAPLSDLEIRQRLGERPRWELQGGELVRQFELPSFGDAIAFVTRVGFLAEKADHHPDLDIRWRKVRVALSTHSEGGITDKDFALAEQIDGVTPGER